MSSTVAISPSVTENPGVGVAHHLFDAMTSRPTSASSHVTSALGALTLFGCALAAGLAFVYGVARAMDIMSARMYELVTETGMPHLEENLRYTITREKRCLRHDDLASAFPVLAHSALKGCRLGDENRQDDTVTYLLSCEGGHGTTGVARWRLGEQKITGQLDVRLGGKNLTFYQRITGTALGACDEKSIATPH